MNCLHEQGADEVRIETYLKRWWRWVRSGVNGVLMAGLEAIVQGISVLSRSLSVGMVRY
ncbi:MAG: hypothetical protein QNJ34_05390 [Xenococcaceae cyanobacterium MO_188.B29]|nr:hypothetical protein [Xenococcaceae cyanobacterium MO_188.B29]